MASSILGRAYPQGVTPRKRRRRRRFVPGYAGLAGAAVAWCRSKPLWLSAFCMLLIVAALCIVVNGLYQVAHKPTELFFPVSGTLNRSPAETWRHYRTAFRRESTPILSAEFLAALAQTESTGNPLARTYWRWSWSLHPLQIYRPASSAVGLFQMTDGNFQQAKSLCIRDHEVLHGCWENVFYSRVFPSDAVEMTSAYLDETVNEIVTRLHRHASIEQKESLAALVHLCGAGIGERYARAGFTLPAGQRCGAQNPRAYLARVKNYRGMFEDLAALD